MRRRLVLVLVLVSAVFIAGTGAGAYAYWKSTGGGSGSAATGTAQPVVLTPATPSAGLYPGGTTNVVLVAANPNTFPVRVSSLALDTTQGTGGFAVDVPHSGCAPSVLSFTTQTNGGAGWTVPAKVGLTTGTLSITLANPLAMSTQAANACQGATFTVYLAAGS